MVNNLMAQTISHYGVGVDSAMESRRKACLFFSKVIGRAKRRAFWQKLMGKENTLKNLSQTASNAKREPARQTGIISIPLNKIVGSEGRSEDFDAQFNPINEHIRDRWVGILSARRNGVTLPPVQLIQVGDEYFVQDGNHRISVANALGQAEIEAQILYALEL